MNFDLIVSCQNLWGNGHSEQGILGGDVMGQKDQEIVLVVLPTLVILVMKIH